MGTVEAHSNKSCSREGLQSVKSVKYSANNSGGWKTGVGEVIQCKNLPRQSFSSLHLALYPVISVDLIPPEGVFTNPFDFNHDIAL